MIVIGTDTHRKTHTCGAVEALTASARGELTGPARRGSFGKLLHWARKLDPERVWALEDCRHVSGAFERFLIARGERVRVAPKHMAGARRSARERGKSDSIDALSVAKAALRLSAAPVLAAVLEAGFGGPTGTPITTRSALAGGAKPCAPSLVAAALKFLASKPALLKKDWSTSITTSTSFWSPATHLFRVRVASEALVGGQLERRAV